MVAASADESARKPPAIRPNSGTPMNGSVQLVNFDFQSPNLVLSVNLFVALAIVAILLGLGFFGHRFLHPSWRVVTAKLRIGQIGEIEIKPNHDTVQLAHKAWVELYDTKGRTLVRRPARYHHRSLRFMVSSASTNPRTIAKEIPAGSIKKDPDTRKLVDVIVSVLNRGMRPRTGDPLAGPLPPLVRSGDRKEGEPGYCARRNSRGVFPSTMRSSPI